MNGKVQETNVLYLKIQAEYSDGYQDCKGKTLKILDSMPFKEQLVIYNKVRNLESVNSSNSFFFYSG